MISQNCLCLLLLLWYNYCVKRLIFNYLFDLIQIVENTGEY